MKWVSAGCLVSVLTVFGGNPPVHAIQPVDWSVDLVLEVDEVYRSYTYRDHCPNEYQPIQLFGGERVLACVYGSSSSLRIASYRGFSNEAMYGVAFPVSSVFYSLSICEQEWGCVYAVESDTLYVPRRTEVVMYTNATSRLKRSIQPDNLAPSFSFSGAPSALLELPESNNLPHLILSKNGSWLGVWVPGWGFSFTDTTNNELFHVVWAETSVVSSFALSNDGATLAALFPNGNLALIHLSACGFSSDNGFSSEARFCPSSSTLNDIITETPIILADARFSDDSRRLHFTADFRGGQLRKFIVSAGKRDDTQGKYYIALGDSFTSGEGELDDNFYQPGTNVQFEKCHLSTRSYPYLLGVNWGIPTKSVACSGAVIADVLGRQGYSGQNERLLRTNRYNQVSRELLIYETLQSLTPGRIPQGDFVSFYQPRIVTIGIGGNDAGLMAKVKNCLAPGTCDWAKPGLRRAQTAKELQELLNRYIALFATLREKSPRTVFVAVGYPLPSSTERTCPFPLSIMLDDQERRYLNETIHFMNTMMAVAASATGTIYVDTEQSFEGRRLCDSTSESAMSGIRFGDDFMGILGQESFHPTPFGHTRIADTLSASIPTIPSVGAREEYVTDIHQESLTGYWGSAEYIRSVPVLFAVHDLLPSELLPNSEYEVEIDAGIFEPFSSVSFELHSEVQVLKKVITNERGEIKTSITIPPDISGVHTLVLSGISPVGKRVDVYSSVTIADSSAMQESMSPMSLSRSLNVVMNNEPLFLGNEEVQGVSDYQLRGDTRTNNSFLWFAIPGAGLLVWMIVHWYRRRRVYNKRHEYP